MVLGALVAVALVAACGENIEAGAACPILCPAQNVTVIDTIIDPVDLDSTVVGYPLFGSDPVLLLASRGDTLETRPVVRFDSLLKSFFYVGVDSLIQQIDSPYVKIRFDRTRTRAKAPVTIDVFDVDTIVGDTLRALDDTATAVEKLLFRPDRLVGSVTLDTAQIGDSVRIKLDSLYVLTKILDTGRVRLGFKVSSAQSVSLEIISREGADAPVLRYDPSPDTTIKALSNFPESKWPRSQPVVRSDYADYFHVIKSPPVPPGDRLFVGSLPGRRSYLRFVIPTSILDSSIVLRATLLLTQAPVRGLDDSIPLTIFPQIVTASAGVIDVGKAAHLIGVIGGGFDSVSVTPRDSGTVSIEIVNALRGWSLASAASVQRALVLRSSLEGADARFVSFFSREGPLALRPRLRVSYSPVKNFGIP